MSNHTDQRKTMSIERHPKRASLVAILKYPEGEDNYTILTSEILQYIRTLSKEERTALYLRYGNLENRYSMWGWAYRNLLAGGDHNQPFITWYLKNIYPTKFTAVPDSEGRYRLTSVGISHE